MPKTVTAKHWPWAVTLFLTMVFWLHTCNINKKLDKAEEQVTQLNLQNQTDRQLINKQGTTIRSQEVVITRNRESLSRLTDTIFNLRAKDARNLETIAYYKGVTKVVIKDKFIPYIDTVYMERFKDSAFVASVKFLQYVQDSMVVVPRPAFVSNPHYTLGITTLKQGINLDSLIVPDSLYLRFAEKSGFLRRPTIEVQYFHTNPYIQSISSQSAYYRPKTNFFTRYLLPIGIGIGAGILISK